MKELIEKYKKEIALNRERKDKLPSHEHEARNRYSGKIVILKGIISDLEALQSKGKTKSKADCLSDNGFSCKNLERHQHRQLELAMEEYAQSHANKDGLVERFKRPTDDEVVSAAILFNEGKLEPEKLSDMVALADFIIDRLYENGDMSIPTAKENACSNEPQI